MEENKIIALVKQDLSTIQGIIGLTVKDKNSIPAIALQEIEFLNMHMLTKPFIAECEPASVLQAVKYSLKNSLSLDPNAGLVYLMPSSVRVGNAYVKVLEIKPTAEGKISMAKEAKSLLYNEQAKVKTNAAGKVISASVRMLFPCPVGPIWETVEIDENEFERLRKFSHIKNARGKQDANLDTLNYANPLYTNYRGGIDPEFARSKVISAALKKRGTNMGSRMASQPFEMQNEPIELTPTTVSENKVEHHNTNVEQFAEAEVISEVKTESFAQVIMPAADDL